MSTTIITVDAKGQSCPGPLVSLAKAIKGAPAGVTFELLATDPGSSSDVPSWAELTGNDLAERRDARGRLVPVPDREGG